MNDGIEQSGYPNIPGEYGIDFSKFGFGKFTFKTASGAELTGESWNGYLSVTDKTHEMTAKVDDYGSLECRLFTKDVVTYSEKGTVHIASKHPDMFASYFLEVALSNFEKQGVKINEFRDIWTAGTDTYEKYKRVLEETGSKVEAARANLFKPVIVRGLTHINTDDIREIVYPNSPEANCVYTKFTREEVPQEQAKAA